MTPDEEIERIKKDFELQWQKLEKLPEIQEALRLKDPVRLGEVANKHAWGDYSHRSNAKRKQHLAIGKWMRDQKPPN